MTIERSIPLRAGRPRRSRGVLAAAWAVTLFLTLLALLAMRMGTGLDPALRARAAATPPPVRRILVRRVVERRVIVHLPPTMPARASRSSLQLSAGAGAFPTSTTHTS